MDKKVTKLYITGMHCLSCELLIERKLKELPGVRSADVSLAKNEVIIEYEFEPATIAVINQLFKNDGYVFSTTGSETKPELKTSLIIGWSIFFIGLFILLNWLNVGRFINVDPSSTWPVFLLLGLVAGFSSCAALVGGIILAMSKRWSEKYRSNEQAKNSLAPHLLFNSGRLAGYVIGGFILGGVGSFIKLTPAFSAFLVIAVSVLMVILGMQMLGNKFFQKIKISLPKRLNKYSAQDESHTGRFGPFIIGSLTFFLPCGFTITAQSMALISGNALTGGLIMLAFALGTLPALALIGWSSFKLLAKPKLKDYFLKVAGVLVLFLALFNINNQLNVLGANSFSDIGAKPGNSSGAEDKNLAPIIDGKQVMKMEASASGYKPNYFKVRAGQPVRWEIKDIGTSGCTNAVISKDLFTGQIDLVPTQTSVKEFTPAKAGRYKFSCWMGMVTGTIEVVDANNSAPVQASDINNNTTVEKNTDQLTCTVNGCGLSE